VTTAPSEHEFRRVTRERARDAQQVRLRSVAGVHGALRSSLRTGLIGADEHLEEAALVDRFSVSRNAVRAALSLLAEEGVVSRSPRAGTIVRAAIADVHIDNGVGWSTAAAGLDAFEVVEDRTAPATPLTRLYLADEGAEVHLTEIVHLRGGEPVLLYSRFSLPGPQRPLVMDSSSTGFGAQFASAYGGPLGAVDCWVEAVEADAQVAERLAVPEGTALLVKSRVLSTADGRPREFSITHYVASRTTLSTVSRSEATTPPPLTAAPAPPPARSAAAARTSAASVHGELRAAVRTGVLPVGVRLQEQELAARFGMSRNSVRRGLARLVDEGLVRRNRSSGTVLDTPIADLTLDNGIGWTATDTHRYRAERSAVATVPTPPFLADMLRTDDPTITVSEHLVHRDGRPFIVYLRYTRAGLTARPLSCDSPTAFEDLFARTHGAAVDRIETTLHAVRAHERMARALDVAPSTLLLLKERLLVDEQGTPREFSHTYYAAAGVALSTHSGH
jgi:DNA-binding GntR family transcriptional regulator